jgi:hypothetical protein|tara:strand:+ start:444 stop:647 length:204 start_codon:yes stop_codon:yes gene_type:complete
MRQNTNVIKKNRDYIVTQVGVGERTRFLVEAESPYGLSDGCTFVCRNHPKAQQVYQTGLSAEYSLEE